MKLKYFSFRVLWKSNFKNSLNNCESLSKIWDNFKVVLCRITDVEPEFCEAHRVVQGGPGWHRVVQGGPHSRGCSSSGFEHYLPVWIRWEFFDPFELPQITKFYFPNKRYYYEILQTRPTLLNDSKINILAFFFTTKAFKGRRILIRISVWKERILFFFCIEIFHLFRAFSAFFARRMCIDVSEAILIPKCFFVGLFP